MGGQRHITPAGWTWILRPEEVYDEVAQRYNVALHDGVRAIANSYVPKIEKWMTDNAAWEDRTGLARDELYAGVEEAIGQVVLNIGHGVHYGLFLEVNYAGRFAILNPALDHFAPQIMADIRRMLGR